MKIERKCPTGRLRSKCEKQDMKDVTQKEEEEEEFLEERDRQRHLVVRQPT
jgi:hypothetical protein